MNIEELREYCLSKKAVEETFPFDSDTLVFKVLGKAFLLTGLSARPFSFNVKCEPGKAVELREQYEAVKPGFHMNKKHWNTITPDETTPIKLLKEWIDHSYSEVVKGLNKKQQQELRKA
jgi:predicted DNA-binding protein (MmcQ/YjbR family)